jgi:ADP-ribose pyrophosphatase YjhB (NUDIX family)
MPKPARLRIAAKAILVRDGRICLVQCEDEDGPWFMLPGGGQEPGETLDAALRRECLEEIQADVVVGPLLFVRDYIVAHHEFADRHDESEHQVELMFACELVGDGPLAPGSVPDPMQTGVAWLGLDELDRHRVYPRALAAELRDGVPYGPARYLGDVN